MSNHRQIIELIRSFTGQANVLTIPRVFVDYVGTVDGGLFLSQVLYWSDKSRDPKGWFYKTYAEWEEELGLSEYQIRKHVKRLSSMGILETKVKKANGNPTVHYRLKEREFSVSFLEFLQERKLRNFINESEESEETLTETTTETTDIETPSLGRALQIFLSVTKIRNADKLSAGLMEWLEEQEDFMYDQYQPKALEQAIIKADKEGEVFNVQLLDRYFAEAVPTVTEVDYQVNGNGRIKINQVTLSNGEQMVFTDLPDWLKKEAREEVKERELAREAKEPAGG